MIQEEIEIQESERREAEADAVSSTDAMWEAITDTFLAADLARHWAKQAQYSLASQAIADVVKAMNNALGWVEQAEDSVAFAETCTK